MHRRRWSERVSATTHQQQTEQQRFDSGLRDVFDAGQGAMTLVVLTPDTSVALIIEVMNGEAGARTVC